MSDWGGKRAVVAVWEEVDEGQLHGDQHACLAGKRAPLSETTGLD